eukprot:CAMPEP_0197529640 /NCGR_PEP_ID=MMETSP1318-20131121/29050_1 /TAXON_ID=552666 /ORGANISM="Partenskyella glossopodia, Strain RCC365" /LENGTH=440 /DNA_ID=CAMNT_0043085179 /DNA_START=40 /DNA_END=1362 /DNA_ORIENTATION=-
MIQIIQRLANIRKPLEASPDALREKEKNLQKNTNPDDVEADFFSGMKMYQSLLSSTCEFIHGRASQLLLVRKHNIKSLNLNELKEIAEITDDFIQKTEQLCGKKFYGLRGTLKEQVKRFLEVFHTKNLNNLKVCLESEIWKQADVPREFQDLIDGGFKRKIQPAARDGVESKISRVIFFAVHGQNGVHSGFLKFHLVGSTLILLKMISRYVECAAQLKGVGSDVLNKLILLLQLFNSRSCGLVLGAAAIQTAGLKNINVTHLALASQSLGLVISQIPVVRDALTSHLPRQHRVLLDNFNAVKGDYERHQQEIFNKLVHIIQQLAEGAMKNLVESPWAQGREQPKIKVEKGIKLLMKQTASMHNKLSSLIDEKQRDQIFRAIANVYTNTTKEYLSRLFDKGNSNVRKKVSAQVQHILSRLRSLAGLGRNACDTLEVFLEPM